MNAKMQTVNLFPPHLKIERDSVDIGHLYQYLGLLCILLTAYYALQYWQWSEDVARLDANRQQHIELQAQLQQLQASLPAGEKQRLASKVEKYQQALAEKRSIQQAYLGFGGDEREGFHASLAAIANTTDKDISIQALSLRGRKRHLSLSGQARNAQTVPAYLERLRKTEALSHAVFDGLSVANGEGVVSFELGSHRALESLHHD